MITQHAVKALQWRKMGISFEDIQWLLEFYFNEEYPLVHVGALINNAKAYWRNEKDKALEELEDWWEGGRGRFVKLEADTTYGATDWKVHLGNVDVTFDPKDGYYQPDPDDTRNFGIVCAAEAGYDTWKEPNVVCARTPNKEWTGPGPVIKAAIKRADELGL
jgi:hypothetical protein